MCVYRWLSVMFSTITWCNITACLYVIIWRVTLYMSWRVKIYLRVTLCLIFVRKKAHFTTCKSYYVIDTVTASYFLWRNPTMCYCLFINSISLIFEGLWRKSWLQIENTVWQIYKADVKKKLKRKEIYMFWFLKMTKNGAELYFDTRWIYAEYIKKRSCIIRNYDFF